MSRVAILLGLVALSFGVVFWGVNHLMEKGAERERATIERQLAEARTQAAAEANENYRLTVQAIEAMRRESERAAVESEAELKRLRDERAGDGNGGDVVFDERWNDWLHGRAAAPAAVGR